jgi:hypothetical protein
VAYSWHAKDARQHDGRSGPPPGGARARTPGLNDAALLDAALKALVARYRAAEIDAAYAAYDERPLDEPDEWGDLASFRDAASTS